MARALDALLLPPAVWTTFPAGHVRLPPHAGARLARLGLKRGWPDVLIVHAGRVHRLELKRQGGALSRTRLARTRGGGLRILDGQADVFPRLRAAGMLLAVAASLDEALAALAGWGLPLRARRSGEPAPERRV